MLVWEGAGCVFRVVVWGYRVLRDFIGRIYIYICMYIRERERERDRERQGGTWSACWIYDLWFRRAGCKA